jgi:hypothetical protein
MDLPIQFPSEAEVIAEEVRRFRMLSPAQRVRSVLDLISTGTRLMRNSPRAEFMRQYTREQEELAQQVLKELIARHGG